MVNEVFREVYNLRMPEKSRTRSPASSSLNLKVSISYHVNQKLFSISLSPSSKAQELHRSHLGSHWFTKSLDFV